MHTAIIHPQDVFYGGCNKPSLYPADVHVQTRFTDAHERQTSSHAWQLQYITHN